jgi:hypothetical protein
MNQSDGIPCAWVGAALVVESEVAESSEQAGQAAREEEPVQAVLGIPGASQAAATRQS